MRAFLWGRKMPLPNILEFIGTNITQRKFQEAQEKLLSYLGIEVPTKTELNSEISKLNNTITPKADKIYVDSALSSFQNGALKTYPTLAAANADITNITLNTKVEVLSATEGGSYYKATAGATGLTKSPYDPIEQAKVDATTKANAAELNAKGYADTNKLDLSKITTEYVDGNKIGAKTPRYTNLGIYGTFAIQAGSAFDSLVLEVDEDAILFLLNDSQNYNASYGGGYAFFSEDPNLNRTQNRIVDNRVSAIDATTSLTYNKVTVPVGAKYLMINTRWTNTSAIRIDFTWAIHSNKFSNSYISGAETVRRINSAKLVSLDAVNKAKDEAILAAKNDTTKLSVDQVRIDYIGGNKIGPKTLIALGSGVNTANNIVSASKFDCVKMQVTAGQVLRLHNQEASYKEDQGAIFRFFTTEATGEAALVDNRVLKTDITTGKTYYEVTVPISATYLVLNKRFTNSIPTTYNYTWGVYSTDAFSFDYTAGKEIVVSVNGVGFKENALASTNDWDLFVTDGVIKGYVTSTTPAGLGGATEDWRVFKMDVKEGVTYYLKLKPLSFLFPFKMIYSKSTTLSSITADFVSNVGYVATNIPDVYRFTVPKGSGIKSMIMNIKIDTGSYTLNIVDTLSIQEGGFDENKVGVKRKSVSSINGNSIKDEFARQGLAPIANKLESRFLNKKVFCFGDSITQGTEGGYVKYLSSTLGCDLSNFGSSGATAKRLVDIVVAGSGIPRRDTTTAEWAVKDYTQCSAVTLQIGTNDFHSGAISDIPTTDLSSYADPLEYWALFPSNYVANIALCIEYIKSKNPECEIFLITPPYRNKEGDTPSRMGAVLPFLKAVSEHYSVPLINSMQESGIGFRYMKGGILYSYDGIHFNELGNKLWGKCIAQKMLSIS